MRPPLYILAGGESRRFGSDKARALVRGRSLIESVAAALRGVASGVVVVAADEGRYADLGLTTIGDTAPGLGPLGGLATALDDMPVRHPGQEWLLLVACDLVDPDPSWLALLASAAALGAGAVAFSSPRGWEPLFGLYHRGLAPEVQRRIGRRDLSLHGLLDTIGATSVPTPPDFLQANTPADLPV